ncbi:unnamed protein product [Arabidopsis thaliana]|uniref:Transmembrane protein n=1 Tax=Arabidopsis thaliana TaxID=3702 RepID=A0A654FUV7_ARATH|nr:unnamed protein product [Arabidopsis thaliana]
MDELQLGRGGRSYTAGRCEDSSLMRSKKSEGTASFAVFTVLMAGFAGHFWYRGKATLERLALSRAIDEKSKKIRLLKREVEAIELKPSNFLPIDNDKAILGDVGIPLLHRQQELAPPTIPI